MSGFWNGTPSWVRWSFLVTALGFLILLSNAKNAIDNLSDYTPVTWGGLEAWSAPLIRERNDLIAQLETRLQGHFNEIAWTQLIYRTQDLAFQISLLKNQQTMLRTTIASNPNDTAANEFREERLAEITAEIERKEQEWREIECLIENRNQPSGGARC